VSIEPQLAERQGLNRALQVGTKRRADISFAAGARRAAR
jgi:hypothetical protein